MNYPPGTTTGRLPIKRLLIPLLIAITLAACTDVARPRGKQVYFRVGQATDGSATLGGGVVLMGGSTDVDAAFQWMCNRASGGDFLVVRSRGDDAYNSYIQALCPHANSVATVIVDSVTGANDPVNAGYVRDAEMIWIAGGDQSSYINFWKGTAFQQAIQARITAGAPVGGTSAGLNVLTQFIYTAQAPEGTTSRQSLADPFNGNMSFDRDFITGIGLDGIIGDPHFGTRDRMGRLLAFMCRVAANGWAGVPKAIAVDERTALLFDPATHIGTVTGSGNVYFLQAPGAAEACAARTPLTYSNLAVQRIKATPGDSFDLATWNRTGGTTYTVGAAAGVLTSTQSGGSPY